MKSLKRTARAARNAGLRLHAHPRLGDDAEDPLRPQQHAVGRRPGAGARQPPRLPRAARRDRADRLHEVVDVGPDRREVPARARRDPAAERRQLERLREEAHRQPVLGRAGASSAGPATPAWIRAARDTGSTSTTRSSRDRSSETTPSRSSGTRGSTPPTTLVPPPNGMTATSSRAAHSSVASIVVLVAREDHRVRRVVDPARGTPGPCPGTTARRRARPGRADRSTSPRSRPAAGSAASGSDDRAKLRPAARRRRSAGSPARRGPAAPARPGRAWRPRSPSPTRRAAGAADALIAPTLRRHRRARRRRPIVAPAGSRRRAHLRPRAGPLAASSLPSRTVACVDSTPPLPWANTMSLPSSRTSRTASTSSGSPFIPGWP